MHDQRPQYTSDEYVGVLHDEMVQAKRKGSFPCSYLLGGPTGVGKSTIIKDVAAMIGARVVIEDLTLKVPGDLGMPVIDREEMMHRFTPPPWWPKPDISLAEYRELHKVEQHIPDHLKAVHGKMDWPDNIGLIVVFEELCRARDDVLAGAMNLLLEHEINGYRAPDWVWFIGTTNWVEDGYRGVELDPAQKDRLIAADFKPTLDEWERFCEGRTVKEVVKIFVNNPERLRLDDDERSHGKGGQDVRITPRRAFKVAEAVHFLTGQELEDRGEPFVRGYVQEPTLARKIVKAAIAAKKGENVDSEPTVSAAKLLKNDKPAWAAFKKALEDNEFGVVTSVVQTFPQALDAALRKGGNRIPKGASKFLKALPDEMVGALAVAMTDYGETREEFGEKMGKWKALWEALDKAGIE